MRVTTNRLSAESELRKRVVEIKDVAERPEPPQPVKPQSKPSPAKRAYNPLGASIGTKYKGACCGR